MNSNDFTKCLLWKNVKKCVQHIVPYCATLWSVCVWTSSSAGSDWHTHSARSDESVCWCTVFTLNILYSLCVFFQSVNVCMQNICHSVSQHVDRGNVSISLCLCHRTWKKEKRKTPPFNFRRVFELVLVEEKHYGCQIMTEERQRGTKLKEHSDFPGCSRFCCFTTITSHFV